MIDKLLKLIYALLVLAVILIVAWFFMLGVWSIYGRSAAFWALAGLSVFIIAICSKKPEK